MEGGKFGSNLFVLISGFFLVNNQNIDKRKIFKIIGIVTFYSISIYCLMTLLGLEKFSVSIGIKNLFPIIFEMNWFASTYLVLYILSPYLNKFVKTLDNEEYKKMLIILTILWSIIPTSTGYKMQSNALIWFIFLYLLAGYIRIFNEKFTKKSGHYLKVGILLYVFTFLTSIIIDIIGINNIKLANKNIHFFDMQSIFLLLSSIYILIYTSKVKEKSYNIINVISSATFGIYLIHDNRYIRNMTWNKILCLYKYQTNYKLVLYCIGSIFCIFLFSLLIELIRKKIEAFCKYKINFSKEKRENE